MLKDTVLWNRKEGSGKGIVAKCNGGTNRDLPTARAVGRTDGRGRRLRAGGRRESHKLPAQLCPSLCPGLVVPPAFVIVAY